MKKNKKQTNQKKKTQLDSSDFVQFSEYTKIHWCAHFKRVNSIFYELNLNRLFNLFYYFSIESFLLPVWLDSASEILFPSQVSHPFSKSPTSVYSLSTAALTLLPSPSLLLPTDFLLRSPHLLWKHWASSVDSPRLKKQDTSTSGLLLA